MKSTKALFNIFMGSFFFYNVAAYSATLIQFKSQTGDYIGQGKTQTFTPNEGLFSASHPYNRANALEFHFQGNTSWSLDFAAPEGQKIRVGSYENATRFPFNSTTSNGFNISGNGRGCNTLTGRFDVLEAVYATTGEIKRFAANFEQHCEGGKPALLGSIRYNATIGYPARVSIVANQSHGSITVKTGSIVNITVSEDAGDDKGIVAEKWIAMLSAKGNYWYTYDQWYPFNNPLLWAISPLSISQKTIQWRATEPGVYMFMFTADKKIDYNLDSQYTDHVVVTVK
jgi:hypothetical protein